MDLQAEVQRVMRDFFSLCLDDGLLHGDGAPPAVLDKVAALPRPTWAELVGEMTWRAS